MKLSINGIKNTTDWEKAGIKLPSYDVEKVAEDTKKSPVWVHFGIGNIFRIFIGGIADSLLEQGVSDKGITCVETFDFDVVDKIYKPFDNLVMAVTLKEDGNTEKKVLGSLTEAIKTQSYSQKEWERLKEIFADPGLQMVSFTITEKGYALKDSKGEFFSFIREDIDNGPEKATSAMAVTAALLYERFKACKAPIAVVSMDNCSHNGEKLRNSITEMVTEWNKKGFVGNDFVDYVNNEELVSFPWSMIDKITPRPADSVAKALEEAGVEDMSPVITSKKTYIAPFVNAEGPQYLVIEDRFPNGRPQLEKAGVFMTDRQTVNKVERMKVTTCLNPLHTALAVYGCLLGYNLIADEMKDKELSELVRRIGLSEGMPVVINPEIISPQKFVDEVLNVRIPNPFMPDTPQRIATDTSQKVGIRYGETIKSYVAKDGSAKELLAIPLAIAGWCRYLLGIDDNGESFELSPDPMADELKKHLSGIKIGDISSYTGQLKNLLSNANIFGINLYEAGIGDKIEEMFVEEIAGNGVRAKLDAKEILCGKKALLETNGIAAQSSEDSATAVYVALDGKFIGEILLGDEIKETSATAVSRLRELGVETVLLTGDKKDTAEKVAKKVGIKTFFSELLPENKVEKVEQLIKDPDRRLVAFAGDGINDAPVIARADIGIAMGGLGSDIAIEAADVVLMNDDPSSIADAVKISRKTMTIVRENIIFALGVKALVLIFGALGLAGMWLAVFADVGVAVIAILNALRSSRIK